MSTKKAPEFQPVRMPQLHDAASGDTKQALPGSVDRFSLEDEKNIGSDPYNTLEPFVAPRFRKS